MNILEELKLSKKQSKDERYDYLCSEFNAINYCINLEKYTNKLQQENKQLKAKLEMYENGVYYSSENDKLKEVIEEVREYINSKVISNGEIIDQLRKIEVKELLQILDKAKGEMNNE